jgi:hypothetical protein
MRGGLVPVDLAATAALFSLVAVTRGIFVDVTVALALVLAIGRIVGVMAIAPTIAVVVGACLGGYDEQAARQGGSRG